MRHAAGEIVFVVRDIRVRYSPSQGSSTRYVTSCPHGKTVNARRKTDAIAEARHAGDWCDECRAEGQPTYD
jgi:hypothetical protein